MQGLQVHSSIQAGPNELPCLGAEDFATDAHGYALISWENWAKNHALRSRNGFLAILPGDKMKQAAVTLGEDQNRVVLKELVMQVPDASIANPFPPYSLQKRQKPQICPKFVPAIVLGGSSQGD